MTEQISFKENGNLAPCPHRQDCQTYKVGCQGISYWCKRYDKRREHEQQNQILRTPGQV